jgi:putative hemolysin
MWGFELAVMLLMIAVNGVLAAYEIALAAVSLARLHLLREEGRAGAAAAEEMKKNMEGSLATIQVGITLVGAVAAAIGGAGAEVQIAPWLESLGLPATAADAVAILLVVLPLTAMTIIFGELVPKVLALRNKEWICLTLSPVMQLLSYSVWPLVWLFETSVSAIVGLIERLTRATGDPEALADQAHMQELKALAAMARTSRLIGEREERIILSAARLSSRSVREIMLPPEQMSLLSVTDALSSCLVAAHLEMHTRYPVTERPGDAQGIIGYVNFKDIVAALRVNPTDPSIRGILRPILKFVEGTPIAHCLETMIHERSHIALVRNAESRVLGMVTLEDITEELLGEIQDEHDRLATHVIPVPAGWIVGGGVSLARIAEHTGIDLGSDGEDRRKTAIHDWFLARLGRPPHGGDEVVHAGLKVAVRKVRRQQIQELQLTKT